MGNPNGYSNPKSFEELEEVAEVVVPAVEGEVADVLIEDVVDVYPTEEVVTAETDRNEAE